MLVPEEGWSSGRASCKILVDSNPRPAGWHTNNGAHCTLRTVCMERSQFTPADNAAHAVGTCSLSRPLILGVFLWFSCASFGLCLDLPLVSPDCADHSFPFHVPVGSPSRLLEYIKKLSQEPDTTPLTVYRQTSVNRTDKTRWLVHQLHQVTSLSCGGEAPGHVQSVKDDFEGGGVQVWWRLTQEEWQVLSRERFQGFCGAECAISDSSFTLEVESVKLPRFSESSESC